MHPKSFIKLPEKNMKMKMRKKNRYHFICQAGIGLSTAAQAAQGVEHAGTEETDEGDHAQLDTRRGIPARGELADGARFVHPSCGPRNGFS
jgi:hypothetical protein